jgi:hypothetical protein
MKLKVILILVLLIANIFTFPIIPVSASLSEDDFNLTKYDPKNDVMSVRTTGTILFSNWNDIEITKMTSSYVDNPLLGPQIELTMTVAGSIVTNDDLYKYAFFLVCDGNEYVIGYSDGVAVGFELGSAATFVPISDVSGNELSLTVILSDIEDPSNEFEFFGGAIYTREEEYERFLDMAPDRLILITEPSHMSTVSGTITVKGVVRDSIDGRPSGDLRIQIDSGGWQTVSISGSTWSFSLDTTTLPDNSLHTISVEFEGETLENTQDMIEIFVCQDTSDDSVYKSFNQKPNPVVGSWFDYETIGSSRILGIPIDVSNEMSTEIQAYETIEVDGADYDAYRLFTKTTGAQDLGYLAYRFEAQRWTWREDSNFGIPVERTVTETAVIGSPTKTIDSTTTYDPPLETHNNYSVKVGFNNIWSLTTEVITKSNTTESGKTTDNPTYHDNLTVTGECLYFKENHSVFGYTYQNIYLIRTYYENPGMSIIEYYSPEYVVPVQIDMIDPSGTLISSIGLYKYPSRPNFTIENVSFDPPNVMVNSKNKIIVRVNSSDLNHVYDLDILVKENGELIGEKSFSLNPINSSCDVIINNWIPSKKGIKNLTISLALWDHVIVEKEASVQVLPQGKSRPPWPPEIWIIVLLFIVISILIVILVKNMRRKAEK